VIDLTAGPLAEVKKHLAVTVDFVGGHEHLSYPLEAESLTATFLCGVKIAQACERRAAVLPEP
jgi:hypothetical protein